MKKRLIGLVMTANGYDLRKKNSEVLDTCDNLLYYHMESNEQVLFKERKDDTDSEPFM